MPSFSPLVSLEVREFQIGPAEAAAAAAEED